ncbi:MAG: amidohydrolase/deacetylase family metallohydrolase [Chloroflexi bacterium]|nr:amidohydrolase/deacetylase family metallohydrolase [Chloroflexota bacterium]
MAKYDLIIKGGTVVDPSQDIHERRDVAFSNGKVAALEPEISDNLSDDVVDATDAIVTPGLVDLHVHVYWGVGHYGIEPDPTQIALGVTTAVDAGSAGAWTFPAFRRYVMERSATRLFALLNISSMGMISPKIGELEDLRWADVEDAARVGHANPDHIIGIKVRLSQPLAANHDVDALKRAIEAAEEIGKFVMIHVGNSFTPMEELVAMLRPGDVVTHAYHGNTHGALDDSGRVFDGIVEAQKRGVIFDIGHGAGSFSFEVAEKALAQGFYPGNISSDLHVYNIEGPVHDQLSTLSKFLHLGLSLDEVIRLSGSTTAQIMGYSDQIGTLKLGAEGDATVLRMAEGRFTFADSLGATVEGSRKLEHVATIRGGRLYRPYLR